MALAKDAGNPVHPGDLRDRTLGAGVLRQPHAARGHAAPVGRTAILNGNRGEIYRYITKPWDDNDIVLIVRQALERKALEVEKKRLEALSIRQNEELKALNASLEAKVEARTAELRVANDSLLGVWAAETRVVTNNAN